MSNETRTGPSLLHIIANDYFLTEFILDSVVDDPLIKIHTHPKSRHGLFGSIRKVLDAYSIKVFRKSLTLPGKYIDELSEITSNDSVLIFGIDNPKELKIAARFIHSKNTSIFLWNPIVGYKQKTSKLARKIEEIKRIGQVVTFDPRDGDTFKIKTVNQVYRNVDQFNKNSKEPLRWDVYFVGQDKNRKKFLEELQSKLSEKNISSNFIIIRDRGKKYPAAEVKNLHSESIDYHENVLNITQSRCLLEILQENQTGPSIRCLEALFFNKKLITNNASISSDELYHPDRVLILNNVSSQAVADFLSRPLPERSAHLLKKYEFKHWCRQFMIAGKNQDQ